MRIAFWNTYKNENINRYVYNLIVENCIDVVVLAEYRAPIGELENMFRSNGIKFGQYLAPGCDRLIILGKYDEVEPGYQNTYSSIQVVNREYILCCVHLPSKLNGDRQKKDIVIRNIIREIQECEDKLKTENTIVVGDFNENPYELGCLGATGFHGIPVQDVALRKYRQIMQERFKMFYNPMWNLLGDFSYPPGTYYYDGNDVENPFWNMYDQVMFRPCIRNKFVEKELKIVFEIGRESLVNKNRHPIKKISDHLPIIFEVEEEWR